ncbi:MAG: PKD domain-containing protein, partial [Candidatus Cloacimonetes bacterium]|nr:PKD domain-containing protein [Candidatus Cloacimonadota bacterium]
YNDIFITKSDPNGNWLWVKHAGGTDYDYGHDIATDANGNSYVVGSFNGNASFNSTTLTSNGFEDIFVAKIGPIEPTAIFNADMNSGLHPFTVQFTDQSTPGTGTITTWGWEFGNGDTSALQHPLYVYEEPGVYSVTLTVSNSAGLSNSVTYNDYITVMPRFPLIGTNPVARMDFGTVYLGWASEPQPLWIKNPGTASLVVNALSQYLANSPFAVQEQQLPYSIPAGDSLSIHLVFTPQVIGTVVDSLYIHNNSANLPIYGLELRGSGEYVPPLPPENVAVVMDGYNAVITWDAVTQTIYNTPFTPDGYLVFYDGLPDPEAPYYFLAMTPGLTYTHLQVGEFAEYMFYRVIAYRNYGRDGFDINSLNLVQGMPEAEVMKILGAMN